MYANCASLQRRTTAETEVLKGMAHNENATCDSTHFVTPFCTPKTSWNNPRVRKRRPRKAPKSLEASLHIVLTSQGLHVIPFLPFKRQFSARQLCVPAKIELLFLIVLHANYVERRFQGVWKIYNLASLEPVRYWCLPEQPVSPHLRAVTRGHRRQYFTFRERNKKNTETTKNDFLHLHHSLLTQVTLHILHRNTVDTLRLFSFSAPLPGNIRTWSDWHLGWARRKSVSPAFPIARPSFLCSAEVRQELP